MSGFQRAPFRPSKMPPSVIFSPKVEVGSTVQPYSGVPSVCKSGQNRLENGWIKWKTCNANVVENEKLVNNFSIFRARNAPQRIVADTL